jgi:CSLREA domain-containing protein
LIATPFRRLVLLVVLLTAVLAAAASAASATTFTVNKQADTADGACDSDCSLREAITAANANVGADTVAVPPGTYHLTIAGAGEDANATGDLDFTDPNGASTTVVGHSARDTIVDATGLGDRVLDVHTTGITISHLTVTGASVDGSGGGIRDLFGTSFTLTDAAVVGNIASGAHTGGGLDVEGSATVNRSLIASNQNSADGGGVDVRSIAA